MRSCKEQDAPDARNISHEKEKTAMGGKKNSAKLCRYSVTGS